MTSTPCIARLPMMTALVILFAAALLNPGESDAQITTPNLQLNIRGTAQGRPPNAFESRFVSPAANCFPVTVHDPSNDAVLGTATDCLENPILEPPPDNLTVQATTFFRIGSSRLVTRTIVSVRRVNPMSSSEMTHGTAFYPSRGADNVLFANAQFAQYSDTRVILRGTLNMDRFLLENVITYDCHFTIKLPGQ